MTNINFLLTISIYIEEKRLWEWNYNLRENALPATSSLGRSGGRTEKGRRACNYGLWNLKCTSNSPVTPLRLSCQISANQHEAETIADANKYWKTRARVMTSLLMSSPPISSSHRLFRCRYSNSRDVVASSPSFFRPAARAPRRACSLARKCSNLLSNSPN